MGGDARDPITYLSASGLAALINFPLWKAAAIGQSGFAATGNSLLASARILFGPPYKGVAATLFGMTWARAAIFYGCDVGKDMLLQNGSSMALASWLPSIIISTFVQVANQPIVRGTVTIQNPASTHASLGAALVDIYAQRGLRGLWHGTGASVLDTSASLLAGGKGVSAVVVVVNDADVDAIDGGEANTRSAGDGVSDLRLHGVDDGARRSVDGEVGGVWMQEGISGAFISTTT